MYWTYCVEIDINLLALNTIALSDELKNTDKEASLLIENDQKHHIESIDELTTARYSFRFLKIMVTSWIEDVKLKNDRFSDLCMLNIHRWIVSEDNKFYDPYLNKMMTKLMKIVFSRLLKAFKDHGVQIVCANMNKIIINTHKYTL